LTVVDDGMLDLRVDPLLRAISQPYTIFLLNDDMELNRYRKTFIQKMLKELQA
jgi:hypothetical protein